MVLLSELVSYLIKFVVFMLIAVVAVKCGAKYKQNKLEKAAAETGSVETESAQGES